MVLNGGGKAARRVSGRRAKQHKDDGDEDGDNDLAATTVAEDWTGGSGDPELCAHAQCKRPLHMAINWVQCDDCDQVSGSWKGIKSKQDRANFLCIQWFHTACVFGQNSMPDDDDDFRCGCASKSKAKNGASNGKQPVSASSTA